MKNKLVFIDNTIEDAVELCFEVDDRDKEYPLAVQMGEHDYGLDIKEIKNLMLLCRRVLAKYGE